MRALLALPLAFWARYAVAEIPAPENYCATGPVAKLVSKLSNYEPAQVFCEGQYPTLYATTTITTCAAPTPAPSRKQRRRNAGSLPLNERDDAEDVNYDHDSPARAFARLRNAPKSAQDAFCSCIATPFTITVNAECASSQYCDETSSLCKPKRNCNIPARCESESYCLEGPAGACFCHPDTDDAEMGYCMSGGPPERGGCPEIFEDCSANADCGRSRVCIFACCREEPFCVDVADYDPHTPNEAAPKRLFRRMLATTYDGPTLNPRR